MTHAPVSSKNVLFVAYEFPPKGESGVQRSAKFAKYLPEFGYKPLVLTAAEHAVQEYPYKTDPTLLRDVGCATVFRCPGYERYVRELPDKSLLLRRLLKGSILPDRNLLAWVPAARQMALRIARQHRIDLIYTSVSPFSSAILGRRIRKTLGVPWVVDFRDPWTDDRFRVWTSKLHYQVEVCQERRALEAADAIVVVTPTMKTLMAERYPRWADKIHVIPNGFDRNDLAAANGRPTGRQLRIAYTGRLEDYDRQPVGGRLGPLLRFWFSRLAFRHAHVDLSTHSPYYLLHAVRALLDERPELADRIHLTFAGIFRERNLELLRQLKLEDVVTVKGYLPHNESLQLLLDSDLLFLPMMTSRDGRRSYIYSGKVFEYLAARKPILATVPEGDARDLICRARAGYCVDPRNVGAIKSLLAELIEKKAAGLLKTDIDVPYVMQFERRNLTGRLAALFDSLLSRSTSS